MDGEAIAKLALQKMLDYQMPTGEWGYHSVSFEDRYKRVGQGEYARPQYLSLFRKPNAYRTLTAMEILRDYCGRMFDSRIHKAVAWFKQNLSSGWFSEWDISVACPIPDRPDIPYIEKTPDIRHTAQALLGLLKFDRNPGPELPKGLCNILDHQFENGMWPRKPGLDRGVEILRSVCCADLLFHATDYRYRKKLSRLGLNDGFSQKAQVALDLTCAWLVHYAEQHGGLWADEYQTAEVLERLGPWLIADKRYAHSVESAVAALLGRMTTEGWTNSSIPSPQRREVSRYETTVRVCASLCMIQSGRLWGPEEGLQPVRSYLHEHFQPDVIDASDYRYFLHIFYPDCDRFRSITQRKDFFDYLGIKQSGLFRSYAYRSALLQAMSIWLIDCLKRLDMLAERRALGVLNYSQAFLEKEEETLKILDTMRLITTQQPIAELPLPLQPIAEFPDFLLQYLHTGDLPSLQGRLEEFYRKYQLQNERKLPLAGEVYQVIEELLVKVAAEIGKRWLQP
jgi:hypothetical protein